MALDLSRRSLVGSLLAMPAVVAARHIMPVKRFVQPPPIFPSAQAYNWTGSTWTGLQHIGAGDSLPLIANQGDIWYDLIKASTYVFDGSCWQEFLPNP